MELPQHMDKLGQADRSILGEFYDMYKDRQWFNRAEIIDNHPNHLKKTLEIHASYNPFLEMKEILAFTMKYNIAVEVVDLSHR